MAINDFFVWGKGGAKLTPDQIAKQQELAQSLYKQGVDFSPAGHWSVALGRGLSGLAGGLLDSGADRAQREGIAGATDAFNNAGIAELLMGGSVATDAVGAAPVVPVTARDPSPVSTGSDTGSWLQYANQGATRNLPLSDRLVSSLGFLPELGVAMKVVSGGQVGKGEKGGRVGSTRHDHGNAADVDFYIGDRKLTPKNAEDRQILSQIVQRGKAAGITGWGEGDDYMGSGRVHLGFGNAGVWGAGGKGANAPEWLTSAYNSEYNPKTLGSGVQVASADPNFMPQASSNVTMSPDSRSLLGGGGEQSSGSRWVNRQNELLTNTPANGNWMDVQRAGLMEQTLADARSGDPVAQALVQPSPAVSAPIQQQAMTAQAPQTNPVSEALLAQNDMALGGSLAPSAAGQPRRAAPNLQGLIQLANNPFLNDAQRGMVNTALQYQMQQNDPIRALQMQQIQQGLRKGDLEIAAMQQPAATKYGFTTLPDGTVVRTNEATGEVIPAYEGAPKPTTTMQELAAAGLQPGTPEYRQAIIDSQRRGTSVTTNVGEQKEDAKFWEGMGTAQAKQFTDMIDTGNVARRNKVNLDRLSQLAAQSPQGLQGAAVNTLANLGIKLDGASNVEAMESLISQLVPSQRPPGSGTISDADLALYKSSLPRIVNSTKGNQLILETLYAINEHDQAAADIADRVANRELTPAQARAELRKIPNPFDNWQEKVKAASQPQPATQQGQGGNKTKSGVTWSVN